MTIEEFEELPDFAKNLNRRAYGFEIKKNFCEAANTKILTECTLYLI